MGLLVGIFLVAILGLIVGLVNPQVVLSWLPETKRDRSFVLKIFGGAIVVSFVGMVFPSALDGLLMIIFFVSIFVLIVGLIKPDFVMKKAPEGKRTRWHVLMIFCLTALVSLAVATAISPSVEESAADSEQIEQKEEVNTSAVKAEDEEKDAEAEAEAKAKAKEEAEAKAKAEEEAKAKEEAEAKAKAEEEAKAKAEAEAKAAEEEAKAKAEAEAKAKAEEEAKVTKAQENCKRSAVQYLEIAAFSKQGLIEQLVFEGYSEADATTVVNNLNVAWDSQAYYCAVEYDNLFPMSRQEMIDQLLYEGFTQEEAIYAVDNLGL